MKQVTSTRLLNELQVQLPRPTNGFSPRTRPSDASRPRISPTHLIRTSPVVCSAAAATVAAPVAAAVAAEPLGQLLLGVAALIASIVAGVLVFVCLPSIVAAARALREMELLLRTLRKEIPDTMAVMRLSGMELADVLQEFGGLGSDLTGGVRASARAVIAAEAGVKDGTRAVKEQVLPAAVNAMEGKLKENAKLQHTAQVLTATKQTLQRGRFVLNSLATVGNAVTLSAAARNLGLRGQDEVDPETGLPGPALNGARTKMAPPAPAADSV